jgi:type III pantothenate kinase
MSKKRLLLDQGNTRIKWLWADGPEIDTNSAGTGGIGELLSACSEDSAAEPEEVLLSSVAGEQHIAAVAHFCKETWGIEPRRMQSRREQCGVRNAYADPERLGVDRWLAIIGAVDRFGKPVVIWDLGTASTLDAVDSSGRHLGGMIYPGPATMLRALANDTKLNVPQDFDSHDIISWLGAGENTAECILKGVLAAQVGALNQFLRHVSLQMNKAPLLVVTGGAAGKIVPLLDFEHMHDPWLVFRGMLAQ